MLVNTGAVLSLILKEMFHQLDLCDHSLEKVILELKTADSKSLHVLYGKAEVALSLENKSFSISVIVAEFRGTLGYNNGYWILSSNEGNLREDILILPDFQLILESEENLKAVGEFISKMRLKCL